MAAANMWDGQGCRNCCSYSTLVSTSCNSNEFSGLSVYSCHKLGSSFVAGDLENFRKVKSQLKHGQRHPRHSRKPEMRALYSPLVESFKSVRLSSHQLLEAATREDNMLESAISTSLAPLPDTFLMEQTTTRAAPNDEEEGGRQQQCPSSHLLTDKQKQDITPMPQDPVASSSGDYDSGSNFSDLGYDVYAKRSARARPPSMSLSQSFTVGGQGVTRTVGAVGWPWTSATRIKGAGPLGVITAVAVAILGLATAVVRNGVLAGTPQKACPKCDGYGVQQCHVCEGQGKLIWEGKLQRMDPCPLCFGSCLKKCRLCGGTKMKRGIPPNLQTQPAQNFKKS
ncbi:unnamed protein product [Sphagnum jensenii]|uniref:Uncharacterized protein n=1 Tax=Sphagnum jensenii TaxID=128206 RepID=A0ABP0VP35_9BRYO